MAKIRINIFKNNIEFNRYLDMRLNEFTYLFNYGFSMRLRRNIGIVNISQVDNRRSESYILKE